MGVTPIYTHLIEIVSNTCVLSQSAGLCCGLFIPGARSLIWLPIYIIRNADNISYHFLGFERVFRVSAFHWESAHARV